MSAEVREDHHRGAVTSPRDGSSSISQHQSSPTPFSRRRYSNLSAGLGSSLLPKAARAPSPSSNNSNTTGGASDAGQLSPAPASASSSSYSSRASSGRQSQGEGRGSSVSRLPAPPSSAPPPSSSPQAVRYAQQQQQGSSRLGLVGGGGGVALVYDPNDNDAPSNINSGSTAHHNYDPPLRGEEGEGPSQQDAGRHHQGRIKGAAAAPAGGGVGGMQRSVSPTTSMSSLAMAQMQQSTSMPPPSDRTALAGSSPSSAALTSTTNSGAIPQQQLLLLDAAAGMNPDDPEAVSMEAFLSAVDEAPDWLMLDALAMHVPMLRSDRYPDLAAAPPVPSHLMGPHGMPRVPLPPSYTESGVEELLVMEAMAAGGGGGASAAGSSSQQSHSGGGGGASPHGVIGGAMKLSADGRSLVSVDGGLLHGGSNSSSSLGLTTAGSQLSSSNASSSNNSSVALASNNSSITSSSSAAAAAAAAMLAESATPANDEEFGEDPIAFWEVRNVVRGGIGVGTVGAATVPPPDARSGRGVARPLLNNNRFGMGSSSSSSFQLGGFGQAAVDEVDSQMGEEEMGGGGDLRRDPRRRSVTGGPSDGAAGGLSDLRATGNGAAMGGGGSGPGGGGGGSATHTYYTSTGKKVTVMYTFSRPDGGSARAVELGGVVVGSCAAIEAFTYGETTIDANASTLCNPRTQLGVGALIAGPSGVGGGFGMVSNMRSGGSTMAGGRANSSSPSLFGGYHRANDTATVAMRLRGCQLFYSIGHQRTVRSVALASADESLLLSSAGDGVTLLRQLPNPRASRPNAMLARPLLWSAYANAPLYGTKWAYSMVSPTEGMERAVVTRGPLYYGASTRTICGSLMVPFGAESRLVADSSVLPSFTNALIGGGGVVVGGAGGGGMMMGGGGARGRDGKGFSSAYGGGGMMMGGVMSRPPPHDPFASYFNPPTESLRQGALGSSGVADALLGFTNQDGLVLHMTISSDFKLVATGSSDGLLTFFDLATMRRIAMCQHQKPVRCSAFSKNGKYAISGCVDGSCRLWSTKRNSQANPVSTYFGHRSCVTTVAFQSTQGDYAVSGSEDGLVHLWNAATGATVKVVAQHRSSVLTASFLHYEVPPASRQRGVERLGGLAAAGGGGSSSDHMSGSGTAFAHRNNSVHSYNNNNNRAGSNAGFEGGSVVGPPSASIPREVNFILSACSSFVALAEIKPNAKSTSSGAAADTVVMNFRFDVADLVARDRLSNARFPARLQTIRSHRDSHYLPTITCVVPAPQALMPMCIFICRSDCSIALYQLEVDVLFFENGGAAGASNSRANSAPNAHHTHIINTANASGNVPINLSNELWSDRTKAPITCGTTGPSCTIVLGDAAGNVIRLAVDMIMPQVAAMPSSPLGGGDGGSGRNASLPQLGGGGGGGGINSMLLDGSEVDNPLALIPMTPSDAVMTIVPGGGGGGGGGAASKGGGPASGRSASKHVGSSGVVGGGSDPMDGPSKSLGPSTMPSFVPPTAVNVSQQPPSSSAQQQRPAALTLQQQSQTQPQQQQQLPPPEVVLPQGALGSPMTASPSPTTPSPPKGSSVGGLHPLPLPKGGGMSHSLGSGGSSSSAASLTSPHASSSALRNAPSTPSVSSPPPPPAVNVFASTPLHGASGGPHANASSSSGGRIRSPRNAAAGASSGGGGGGTTATASPRGGTTSYSTHSSSHHSHHHHNHHYHHHNNNNSSSSSGGGGSSRAAAAASSSTSARSPSSASGSVSRSRSGRSRH